MRLGAGYTKRSMGAGWMALCAAIGGISALGGERTESNRRDRQNKAHTNGKQRTSRMGRFERVSMADLRMGRFERVSRLGGLDLVEDAEFEGEVGFCDLFAVGILLRESAIDEAFAERFLVAGVEFGGWGGFDLDGGFGFGVACFV